LLSQGERQRILISRALSAAPSILFLDEPCAGLDPVAREDFLAFLQDLSDRGKSPHLVLITHHVEEIIPAITHVLLIRQGRVVAAGKKEQVLNSKLLSETFGAPLRLKKVIRAGKPRYQIDIEDDRRSSFSKRKKPVP
jgi:iron complex transport system ATP-binding protein